MDQQPGDQQPAAPLPPPPAASSGVRPPVITAVAVIEFVLAGLGIVFGTLALMAGGLVAGAGADAGLNDATALGGIVIVLAVVMLVIAALQIYAGVLVLKLRERGRMISVILSGIALALMVLSAVQGDVNAGSLLSLVLNGFIIYACMTNKEAFS